MTELLSLGGKPDSEVVTTTGTVTTATYLNYYAAIGRLGYPTAIASNPILEADDSSPWWQGRMVCRPRPLADPPADAIPPTEELQDKVGCYHHDRGDDRMPPAGFESTVYVDLGSGTVTSLPIGNLVPVTKDWTWIPSEGVVLEEADTPPARAAAPEALELPTAEPAWNEAEDELPTWVELDLGECSSGALMSRRRSSSAGD